MKLLTVAVPSYNMEKLLPTCLGSCLYPGAEKELEVIVVNDGSTDSTLEVAQDYQKRYPDIFRVVDKPNGGHGSGINAGIKHASGKYFKVLDADDWFDTQALASLVKILSTTDAELVTNSFLCVNASTMKKSKPRSSVVGGELAEGLHLFDNASQKLLARMHSVTWRTDILRDNGITISEHCFYVDMEYITKPVPFVNEVYVTELPLYMYRLGDNGQSVSIASMQKHIDHHLAVMDRVLAFIESERSRGLGGRKIKYLERMAAEMAANQCLIYLSYPRSEGMKQKFVDLEERLKKKHRGVYDAVSNKAVLILRKTNYLLFAPASMLVRATRK